MKRKITNTIIYLSGCVCSYFIFKPMMKEMNFYDNHRYTAMGRVMAITFSMFSWISVAAGGIMWGIFYISEHVDLNKTANW